MIKIIKNVCLFLNLRNERFISIADTLDFTHRNRLRWKINLLILGLITALLCFLYGFIKPFFYIIKYKAAVQFIEDLMPVTGIKLHGNI